MLNASISLKNIKWQLRVATNIKWQLRVATWQCIYHDTWPDVLNTISERVDFDRRHLSPADLIKNHLKDSYETR